MAEASVWRCLIFTAARTGDVGAPPAIQFTREALTLADREAVHAGVLAEDTTVAVANEPVVQGVRTACDEFRVLSGGHEANLLAVLLLRNGQSQLTRFLSDGGLVEVSDRELRARELRLRQREEEIRLILGAIDAMCRRSAAT